FGNRGGVYRMAPGGMPESLTERRIERRLQDVDLLTEKVLLAWDDQHKLLRVFIQPYDGSEGVVYVWDRGADAWTEDRYPFSIYAAATIDGDLPADRALLIGCGDAALRAFDRGAVDDDGDPIVSEAAVGPLQPAG